MDLNITISYADDTKLNICYKTQDTGVIAKLEKCMDKI